MVDRRVDWREAACLVDCAVAGLGHPAMTGDERWVENGLPALIWHGEGLGMLFGLAECDGLPVEVGRVGSSVEGVRVEFTSDVAELEASGGGRWVALGRVYLGPEGCAVIDARGGANVEQDVLVPVPIDWYRAEYFQTNDGDHLGLRLLRERPEA